MSNYDFIVDLRLQEFEEEKFLKHYFLFFAFFHLRKSVPLFCKLLFFQKKYLCNDEQLKVPHMKIYCDQLDNDKIKLIDNFLD